MYNWHFEVVAKQSFRAVASWNGTRVLTAAGGYESTYALGTTYTLQPPPTRSSYFVNYAGRDPEASIAYTMVFDPRCDTDPYALGTPGAAVSGAGAGTGLGASAQPPPPPASGKCSKSPGKFYVDQSGSSLAQPVHQGVYDAKLVATDAAASRVVVKEWTFRVLPNDTSVDAFGPGGRRCSHGVPVDAVPFDRAFTCSCAGTEFHGANCASAARRVASTGTLVLAVAVFGSILLLATLAAGIQYYRARQRRNAPFDFSDIFNKLKQDGLLAPGFLSKEFMLRHHHGSGSRSSGRANDGTPVGGDGGSSEGMALLPLSSETTARGAATQANTAMPLDQRQGGGMRTILTGFFAETNLSGGGRGRDVAADDGDDKLLSCEHTIAVVKPREIPSSRLTVLGRISSGAFGEVYSAMLNERSSTGVPSYRVAVKVPRELPGGGPGAPNAMEELFKEAALMAQFDHPNIVALIGVVSRNQRCKVILQYCDRGSLRSLVRADKLSKGADTIPLRVALKVADNVLRGMAYLEWRHYVHRDLAARNVLVTADDRFLVADFGMTRALRDTDDYYKIREGVPIPVRWSAPECVCANSRYTTASDVWSFFVLMREVWSRGQLPFGAHSGHQVMDMLVDVHFGKRDPASLLAAPAMAPRTIYRELLRMCWRADPKERATFSELLTWVNQQTLATAVSDEDNAGNSSDPSGMLRSREGSAASHASGGSILSLAARHIYDDQRTTTNSSSSSAGAGAGAGAGSYIKPREAGLHPQPRGGPRAQAWVDPYAAPRGGRLPSSYRWTRALVVPSSSSSESMTSSSNSGSTAGTFLRGVPIMRPAKPLPLLPLSSGGDGSTSASASASDPDTNPRASASSGDNGDDSGSGGDRLAERPGHPSFLAQIRQRMAAEQAAVTSGHGDPASDEDCPLLGGD